MPEVTHLAGMRMEQLEPFPPEANPFSHDGYHMGTRMGKNVLIELRPRGVIICNIKTGQRLRIDLGLERTKGVDPKGHAATRRCIDRSLREWFNK